MEVLKFQLCLAPLSLVPGDGLAEECNHSSFPVNHLCEDRPRPCFEPSNCTSYESWGSSTSGKQRVGAVDMASFNFSNDTAQSAVHSNFFPFCSKAFKGVYWARRTAWWTSSTLWVSFTVVGTGSFFTASILSSLMLIPDASRSPWLTRSQSPPYLNPLSPLRFPLLYKTTPEVTLAYLKIYLLSTDSTSGKALRNYV